MLNKIKYKKLVVANCFEIEIDRILIFVETISEIEAFRELNFYHFEFTYRNLEQGTISNIFFLGNMALELIRIENLALATRYSTQTNMDIMTRTQWRRNQALPFGFVLRYVTSQQPRSRRRCDNADGQKINSIQTYSQINFSSKNLQELQEPACYIVSKSLTWENLLDNASAIKQRLLALQSKTSKLTNIQITLNTFKPLTKTVSLISTLDLIDIKQENYPKLKLEFDQGCQQQLFLATFSTIPMIISY
ncbi:MAG TPA: hypothetical protein V6C71_06385 [Coleofasciculaceae cyanobacterium]|jgi:hypothetical protein